MFSKFITQQLLKNFWIVPADINDKIMYSDKLLLRWCVAAFSEVSFQVK